MPKYAPLLDDMGRSNGNPLKRTKSNDGMGIERESVPYLDASDVPNEDTDESSSLVFQAASEPEDLENGADKTDADTHDPHHLDIRGMAMLPTVEFWQLFMMLCLLAGIGLMTINNIGNDAQALWSSWDKTVTPGYIQRRQLMHVSIISFFSFVGRLSSGVGSDVIVKKLHMSRFWCLFVSSAIFCVGQICGATISNPNFLFVVSSTTGLAYGFLFGVYPSLVADTFGVHGLSQNWGWMTLAPVISGNIFNLLYGHIFDANSIINEEDGTRKCLQGIHCYKTAYWVTFGAGMFGVVVSLWSIHHDGAMKRRRRKELEERDA
ncbi:MAG: hypothetical protein MMC33_001770 [Icmadophila ericetorum]|nr:hypothetical protein [Icmadophila ericetorum]